MELTNRELFFDAKRILEEKNIEFTKGDIYDLLMCAGGMKNTTDLIVNFSKNAAKPQYFYELLEKYISGEPIQYIIHSTQFIELDLYVDNRVLIPRPETEMLVIRAEHYIKANNIKHDVIADVCTGSGCIAISLKKRFPESRVYGSDISKDALEVAQLNAKNLNQNVELVESDKLDYFIDNKINIDVLISNPPYVEKIEDVDRSVLDYEPRNAVLVAHGTDFYKDFFIQYRDIMNKDQFFMAFEINYDQEKELSTMIEALFEEGVTYFFERDMYDRTRYLFIYKGPKKNENI